jgi:uncharacterized protein (DUF433 family)
MEAMKPVVADPLTDSELAQWETHARENGTWPAEDVLRLIAEVRRLRDRLEAPRIVHDPERCGGAATVGDTRICVWHILALAPRYDWDLEQLRTREFPDLSPGEIQLAVEYYRGHMDEIEASLRREREIRERHRLAAAG